MTPKGRSHLITADSRGYKSADFRRSKGEDCRGSIRENPRRRDQRSSALQGQVSIEFAVLVAIIIGALLVMQIYLKRGISGKLRRTSDSIGEQYDPRNTTSDLRTSIVSDTTTASEPQGLILTFDGMPVLDQQGNAVIVPALVTTTRINSSVTSKSGSETVGALGRDLWR